MTISRYHPTKDFIKRLSNRCENFDCPEVSITTPTLCKKNCPIVKECVNKFGYDLISI